MGITTGHLVRSSPLLPSEIVVSYKFCQVTWQLRIKLLCTCSNVTSGSCSDSRNSSCSTLWSNVAEYPNRCHPKYVISPSHTCTRVWIGCVAAQQGFHFFLLHLMLAHTNGSDIQSHSRRPLPRMPPHVIMERRFTNFSSSALSQFAADRYNKFDSMWARRCLCLDLWIRSPRSHLFECSPKTVINIRRVTLLIL